MVGDGSMKALAQRAAHEAKVRQQRLTTSHVLLVLLQRGEGAASQLVRAGVREVNLLSALKAVDGEPSYAIERCFDKARQVARELGHPEADERHLLFALATDSRVNAHRSMTMLRVDVAGLAEGLRDDLGMAQPRSLTPAPVPAPVAEKRAVLPPARAPHRSAVAKLTRAASEAARPERGVPKKPVIVEAREPVAAPVAKVESPSATASRGRNVRVARPREEEASRSPFALDAARYPLLAQLGRNLTELAYEGRIDDVAGRDAERERMLDILARRRSNNPVLVGPPGVGKTAVVEALAHHFVREAERGRPVRFVVELTAGALTGGTGVRGALSDRIRKLRAEVAKAEGAMLLFFDEIHTLVGGAGDGPDELANELKAALARGELPCVGATTDAEYRKYFERDPALARRFSVVHVDEPSRDAALEMMHRAAPAYEAHHGLVYAASALDAAVDLTVRFVPERRLPDKALAALDQAGARVSRRGKTEVTRADVAAVVAEWASIAVDRLTQRDGDRLLQLERALATRVVGHGAELARIADALRKGAAGFRGKRPLATLLFLGPTGVGKTETAKAISDVFFAGAPMTRIDLSEYSEAHSVAKLLGAPPGYLGHDEGGQLTEPVRKRPYQLVLLDEIEKAHADVLLSLLPLLDEGRATDGRGRTVDFTNTVVVMTSNLGVREAESRPRSIGFGGATPDAVAPGDRLLEAARRALPPELWNRIDEPLHFRPLSRDDVREIARRMLRSVGDSLVREHGVALEFDDTAVEALLAAGGFDPALGARPMRRVVGRLVEAKLASWALEGALASCAAVGVSGDGAELLWRRIECSIADVAE